MDHSPKVVERQQVSNEQVAYRIVCCGAKCSNDCLSSAHICEDSWHTLSIHTPDHEAHLTERKANIADRHAKMQAWKEKHGHS